MSIANDTRITTDQGLLKVSEAATALCELLTNQTVLNLGETSCIPIPNAKVVKSDVLTDIYRLQTIEGFYLDATADHRLLARNFNPKPLKNFQVGEVVYISCSMGGFGAYNDSRIAIERHRTIKHDEKIPDIIFSGNFYMIASFLIDLYKKKTSLLSANKLFLKDIQLLLSNYGIYSKINDPYENLAVFEDIIYPYALTLRPCDKMKLRRNRSELRGIKFQPNKFKHYEAHIESITPLGAGNVCDVVCNGINTVIYNGIIGY